MGSYAAALGNAQNLQNLQSQQTIASNQDAALNIAGLLRTGKHPVVDNDPNSGRDLTDAEKIQLAQKHAELIAQTQDLWNPRQNPNKVGSNLGAVTGVTKPEGLLHKATDALHITTPPVSTDPTRNPSQVLQQLQAISQQYRSAPGQQDAAAANTLLQGKIHQIDSSDLSDEDKVQAKRNLYGVKEKPVQKLYKLPDGTSGWFDPSRPELIPQGATAVESGGTADTRARADYDAYYADPAHKDEAKVPFEQWKTQVAAKGREAGKPENFDHAYQNILIKKAAGRPLSPDEQAHEAAWQLWNRQTKIDPGMARAAAFGANRYIMVVDPNNPDRVIPMRAGDAAHAGVDTPQGVAFKTDAAVTKWATTGDGAAKINNFNTAIDHLKLLKQAALALQNGDAQLFNRISNQYKTMTGEAAPTNFNAVKAAVAGEIAKTFSGATIPEIEAISSTIHNAESDDQILGAADYYTNLMSSKKNALQGQYEAGKKGQPNFDGNGAASTPSAKPTANQGATPKENTVKKNSHGDDVIFTKGKWGPAVQRNGVWGPA